MKRFPLVLFGLSFIAPISAFAQTPDPSWSPQAFERRITLGLPMAFVAQDGDIDDPQVFVPEIGLYLPVGRDFAVSADLGLSVVTGAGDTETALTNLFVAVHREFGKEDLRFRVGLGASFPTAPDDDFASIVATSFSIVPRGLWDLWRGLPRTYAVVAPVRLEHLSGIIGIAGDGAATLYIPEDGGDPKFGVQAALEVYAALPFVDLGGRIQVASLLDAGTDLTQVGLSPFVRAKVGNLRLRLAPYIFLDEPLGVADSGATVYGLEVGLGFVF